MSGMKPQAVLKKRPNESEPHPMSIDNERTGKPSCQEQTGQPLQFVRCSGGVSGDGMPGWEIGMGPRRVLLLGEPDFDVTARVSESRSFRVRARVGNGWPGKPLQRKSAIWWQMGLGAPELSLTSWMIPERLSEQGTGMSSVSPL